MNKIRDLVIQDPVALRKWALVVDDLVQSQVDRLRLSNQLRKDEFESAILDSLRLYEARGGQDLISLLRNRGLCTLSDTIQEYFDTEEWFLYQIKDRAAADMLRICSYLDQNKINLELICKISPDNRKHFEILQRLGLLVVRDGVIKITKAIGISEYKDEELRILSTITTTLDKELHWLMFNDWEQEMTNHFIKFFPRLISHENLVAEAAQLIEKVTYKLSTRKQVASIEIATAAAEKLAKRFGTDSKQTLSMKCNLAFAYTRLGLFDQAQAIVDVILPRAANQHQKMVIISAHADLLYESGQYTKSLKVAESGLDEHRNADQYNDQVLRFFKAASFYRMGGTPDEVLPVLELVVNEFEWLKGRDHPDTLEAMDLLGEVVRDAGLRRAEALHRIAYNKRTIIFGAKHPDTLTSLRNLEHVNGEICRSSYEMK